MAGRLSRAAGAFVLAGLVACGSQSSQSPAASAATNPTPQTNASAEPTAQPLPDRIDDLATAIPADASLVVLMPSLETFGVQKGPLEQGFALLSGQLSSRLGLPENVIKSALSSFDGAAVFDFSSFSAKPPAVGLAIRFKNKDAGEDLIKALKFQPTTGGHYALEAGDVSLELLWLPGPNVAVVGLRGTNAVQAAVDTLTAKRPSFATSSVLAKAKKSDGGRFFAYADLHRLIPNEDAFAAAGSMLRASITMDMSEISLSEVGSKIPRLGNVIAPIPHDALGKLPGTPSAAVEVSVARMPGKTLADFFGEIGRSKDDPNLAGETDKQLNQLAHLSLSDVDHALGDALTIGIYVDPSALGGTNPDKAFENGSFVGALALRDAQAAHAIFDAIKKLSPENDAVWTADKVVVNAGKKTFVLELTKDAAVFGFGDKTTAQKHVADFVGGAAPFAKSPAFAAYTEKATPSQLSLFIDPELFKRMVPKEQQAAITLKTISTDVVLSPSDQGLNIALRGSSAGTAAIGGVFASLGIYGVTKYLASSKAAEAKNTVGAIARSAVAAFEREEPSPGGGTAFVHKLCPTAKPVPDAVPRGTKVAIDSKAFDDPGWKCLKFEINDPVRYQYEYRAGGPYKCTKRGGPDPGPDGFEVSAEGDLNGDGKTSLFCVIGKRSGTEMHVSTQIFISDELE